MDDVPVSYNFIGNIFKDVGGFIYSKDYRLGALIFAVILVIVGKWLYSFFAGLKINNSRKYFQ